ncbi:hypothetical protein [Roseovarius sp. M141]|uniref:hypothetical protein n=1 Tax=Roseovarius sp. M141 TaxID=2583806 RepID=UPI0020CECAB8|nr:hypothetical protein [Roseovarius sp. M141]MCQ0090594.1 hypothetical protein [Roseovarius sp. M141]
MNRAQMDEFRQKLAELAARQDTSHALRAFLLTAGQRDSVDVINEIETLAAVMNKIADIAPE